MLKKIYSYFHLIVRAIRFLWRKHRFLVPLSMWKQYFNAWRDKKASSLDQRRFYHPEQAKEYQAWLNECQATAEVGVSGATAFVVFIRIDDQNALAKTLDSFKNVTYNLLDLCILTEESIDAPVSDPRFHYFVKPQTASWETYYPSVFKQQAIGDWVMFVTAATIVEASAFAQIDAVISNQKAALVYADEDDCDSSGRRFNPQFKPDYSPDTLLSFNYLGNAVWFNRKGIETCITDVDASDPYKLYDIILRLDDQRVKMLHYPQLLIHNLDPRPLDSQHVALVLEKALARRGTVGKVISHPKTPYCALEYALTGQPRISIIIPTRDHSSVLEQCLSSVFSLTSYDNFEVLIINNRSIEPKTLDLFEKYMKAHDNVRVLDADMEFNFSALNNLGVSHAQGSLIVLLNNDTQIVTRDWLQIMAGYACRDHVGAVGAKLFYPDMSVQHGGIVVGVGGLANHAFISSLRHEQGLCGRLLVPYNYTGVTAACLMVEKSKYEQVSGLSEELTVAFNDVDFNLKLLEKGLYNVLLPQVELIHHESKSRGKDVGEKKLRRFRQEHEIMFSRWQDALDMDPYYNAHLSRYVPFLLDSKKRKTVSEN